MKRAALAVGAVLLFALVGCSSPASGSPATSPAAAPGTVAVTFTIDAVVNGDGTVSLTAASNLPDGTELGGHVSAEGGYRGSGSAVLQDGKASFGPFSKDGGALPAGTYEVNVTMPIARNQPEAVKAIIGEHGENLTGPQVQHDDITGDAVVSATKEVVID